VQFYDRGESDLALRATGSSSGSAVAPLRTTEKEFAFGKEDTGSATATFAHTHRGQQHARLLAGAGPH